MAPQTRHEGKNSWCCCIPASSTDSEGGAQGTSVLNLGSTGKPAMCAPIAGLLHRMSSAVLSSLGLPYAPHFFFVHPWAAAGTECTRKINPTICTESQICNEGKFFLVGMGRWDIRYVHEERYPEDEMGVNTSQEVEQAGVQKTSVAVQPVQCAERNQAESPHAEDVAHGSISSENSTGRVWMHQHAASADVDKRHVLASETCSFGSGRVNRKARWRRRTKTPSVPETSAATTLIESRHCPPSRSDVVALALWPPTLLDTVNLSRGTSLAPAHRQLPVIPECPGVHIPRFLRDQVGWLNVQCRLGNPSSTRPRLSSTHHPLMIPSPSKSPRHRWWRANKQHPPPTMGPRSKPAQSFEQRGSRNGDEGNSTKRKVAAMELPAPGYTVARCERDFGTQGRKWIAPWARKTLARGQARGEESGVGCMHMDRVLRQGTGAVRAQFHRERALGGDVPSELAREVAGVIYSAIGQGVGEPAPRAYRRARSVPVPGRRASQREERRKRHLNHGTTRLAKRSAPVTRSRMAEETPAHERVKITLVCRRRFTAAASGRTVVGCAHADVADEGALRAAPSSASSWACNVGRREAGNGAPQCQETLSSREEESILGDSRARTADAIRGSSARGKTTRRWEPAQSVRGNKRARSETCLAPISCRPAKAVRGRLLETRGTAFASADAVESVRSKVAGSGHGRRVRMRTEREVKLAYEQMQTRVQTLPGRESERAEARRRGQAMGVESSGSASHPNARTNQRGRCTPLREAREGAFGIHGRRASCAVGEGTGRWRGVRAHWGVLKAALRAREVSCVLDGAARWRGGATSGMHPDWVQGNEGGALGLTQSRTSVEDGAELSARTARRLRRGELCIVVLGAGESARRIQRRARCGGRYGWCRTLRRAVARLQRLSGGAR
ncbi:hypothetical protein B0H14DRAFT_3663029 [Mycena olivaceomarginata]|nr:hypothetical protein B0H14DRAFT_3663029 [Mycena olivaceomarginata]